MLPRFAALLLLGLLLAACRGEQAVPTADDPAAAIRAQAQALRDNDLARYAELSLPPALYAGMERRWNEAAASAAPVDALQRAEFDEMLQRLTAKNAEVELFRLYNKRMDTLEKEIAGQWPMLQATAGIFLKAAVDNNAELDAEEKAHAQASIAAVLAWVTPELLTDRERARLAITELAASARQLELTSLEQTRQLNLQQALAKGGIAMAGLKRVGRIYGFDADASLDALQVEYLEGDEQRARLRLRYPLLEQEIAVEIEMQRRDGGWYNARTLREAEAELAEPAVALELDTKSPSDVVTD
ncbi:MAG TPA: hypothetical protein VFY12_01175 [Arenimonas sp.]|nr:hypothetical protein [Arenimonas sp.]